MSEYQYYAFQAVDRPLSPGQQETLRAISSRGRITSTSFVNTYQWGDFKGDPAMLMAEMFDLHLYFANWGTRRFAMRLPRRLVDRDALVAFIGELDEVAVSVAGEHLVVDIVRQEVDEDASGYYDDEEDDGRGWLDGLTPLRADVMSGDLRVFYLLWLMAVEAGFLEDGTPEPLPGIGPLTGALETFADFFGIDGDLVGAAAERSPRSGAEDLPAEAVAAAIGSIPEDDRNGLLLRLHDGDPHIAAELRRLVRAARPQARTPETVPRTVGDLRARAAAIAQERLAEAEAAARRAREREEKARVEERRRWLAGLARRGDGAWRDVEAEIERRNAGSYDRAAKLLAGLRELAGENGGDEAFRRRVTELAQRHRKKGRFLERLVSAGLIAG